MRRLAAVLVSAALAAIPGAAPAAAEDVALRPAPIPALARHAATVEAFIPAGFELESQSAGDLNQDGRTDRVLVLRGRDPSLVISDPTYLSRLDTNPRLLAVLMAAPGGGYDLAARSADLIPRQADPNAFDYLEDGGVSVEQGVVRVSLQIWSGAGPQWWKSFGFIWRDGRLRLASYSETVFNRGSGESDTLTVNYLSGVAERVLENDFTDAPARSRHRRFARRTLIPLEAVGDGVVFNPRVPTVVIPQGRTGG